MAKPMNALGTTISQQLNHRAIDITNLINNDMNYRDYTDEEVEYQIEAILASKDEKIIQDIIVTPNDDNKTYRIISGHCRVAAIRELISRYPEKKEMYRFIECQIRRYENKFDETVDIICANSHAQRTPRENFLKFYKLKKEAVTEQQKEKLKRASASKIFRVSEGTIAQWDTIYNNAIPELIEKIIANEIAIYGACQLANQEEDKVKAFLMSKEGKITPKDVEEFLGISKKSKKNKFNNYVAKNKSGIQDFLCKVQNELEISADEQKLVRELIELITLI